MTVSLDLPVPTALMALPGQRDQPVLTAELGRKARLRALERYTISSNIDALEQLYADLMLTSTVAA